MADIYVSNSDELLAALNGAKGGETIVLRSGSYGSLDIIGRNYSSYVTLVSEEPLGAKFSDIGISGSSYVRIDGVHVNNATNGTDASTLVAVTAGSHHVQFVNSEVNGKVDSVYTGHFGLYTKDVSDVLFENNYVHDVKRGGVFYSADRLEVSGNTIDYIGEDSLKFIDVHHVLVENNTGAAHVYPEDGAHLDFIQFQGTPSSDIVIRGNVLLPATQANIQGIYLGDTSYTNVLIENNIVATGMIRGISITDGTNVTVRDNTVLHLDGTLSKAAKIFGATVSYGNIQTSYPGEAGISGGNLTIQHTDPSKPYYYGSLFENASGALGITLQDLAPILGSAAETYGAHDRLTELLTGSEHEQAAVPTPVPSVPTLPPSTDVLEFWLVDPKTDQRVAQLSDGQTVDPDLLASDQYTLEAVVDGSLDVSSVRLTIDGYSRVENVEPYALFGDNGGEGNFNGDDIVDGPQTVTAGMFSGRNASGTKVAELDLDFSFSSDGLWI